MAAKHKLSSGDIDALVNARHPEPRSLLGYHEFARKDEQPLRGMVEVSPASDPSRLSEVVVKVTGSPAP